MPLIMLCSLGVWPMSSSEQNSFITCKIHKSISITKDRKVVCLFCFVCHVQISQTMVPTTMHLVSLKSPWSAQHGVHEGGFIMFRLMIQEFVEHWIILLLRIQQNQNNFLTKEWATFLVLLKKPLMGRILWRWFCNFQIYDARYMHWIHIML
jgi:hypothetical protein